MKSLTTRELVENIALLGIDKPYKYASGQNTLRIKHINTPEGPITFVRFDRNGDEKQGSISTQQLAKIALVCTAKPNYPLHLDRVFSAGGNTRSALETLLLYTPNFFACNPDRFDVYSGEVKRDLKHIMWCPDDTHPVGTIAHKKYDGIINEQEASIEFGDIRIPSSSLGDEFESIDARRTHVQMQVALVMIGNALNLRTWIAKNDHSFLIGSQRLVDLPGVIPSLDDIKIFFDYEIKAAAALIDCIWFTPNYREMPAVFEVEHSTGVTSGMTRMMNFYTNFPGFQTTFTIVAPNELRSKVVADANKDMFAPLQARDMPYTNVRELYGLIQRYALSGLVDHRFVSAFMEQIV